MRKTLVAVVLGAMLASPASVSAASPQDDPLASALARLRAEQNATMPAPGGPNTAPVQGAPAARQAQDAGSVKKETQRGERALAQLDAAGVVQPLRDCLARERAGLTNNCSPQNKAFAYQCVKLNMDETTCRGAALIVFDSTQSN